MSNVQSGMVIAGKYRLEAAIARGGMGSVWRARHLLLDTPVAIKFIGADVIALPEARRRFEREAKAAALLQSPHVVRILDYGAEGDFPYLVMELLNGEDLGTTLKRQGKLSPEDTANIVFQVARALRRAAEAGIVHRDLKPSNVFVIRDDEEDLVKVLDFGIAKAPRGLRADDESTRKGAIIGSPRYMSPEQARGSPLVDPRSDLWSLAVIAYRAVTGELPFQSLDMTDLIVKICTEDPIPPSKVEPSLGPEMDAFFVKALARNPDHRFQTARDFAASFADAAGLPPPSVSSRRILIRHPSGLVLLPELLGAAPSPSPAAPAAPATPAAPPPSERAVPARDGDSGEERAPECETTRVSAVPPAPADAPRATPLPKGTPTPYPSGIDVPPARPAMPRSAMLLRLALGGAIGALLAGAVLALAPRRTPPPLPPAPAAPASLPAIVSSASSTAAPPPAAVPEVVPTPAPQGSAPPVAPAATSARPPALPPPSGPRGKRKHAILGI